MTADAAIKLLREHARLKPAVLAAVETIAKKVALLTRRQVRVKALQARLRAKLNRCWR